MILNNTHINTFNNVFEEYINKYLNYSVIEESIQNHSYKQFVLLKLYCAYNICIRMYNDYQLFDVMDERIYTIPELHIKYDIPNITIELSKVGIDINDIFDLVSQSLSIESDFKAFSNPYKPINLLPSLTSSLNIVESVVEEDTEIEQIYSGDTRWLSLYINIDGNVPDINNEWQNFTLTLRQNGVEVRAPYYWLGSLIGFADPTEGRLGSILGEIQFKVIPGNFDNPLLIGLVDIRIVYTQLDNQTITKEVIGAININP